MLKMLEEQPIDVKIEKDVDTEFVDVNTNTENAFVDFEVKMEDFDDNVELYDAIVIKEEVGETVRPQSQNLNEPEISTPEGTGNEPAMKTNAATSHQTVETHQKRKFHQYSEENLQKALEAVRNGAKIRPTCRIFGIPRGTVQDRLRGRISDKPRHMGPDPYLTIENERKIVDWIINLGKYGFTINKRELINAVQKIVQESKMKTPFKDGKPGQKWYSSFLRRHPQVSSRISESADKSRAKTTEEYNIKSWFRELEKFLNMINANDVLKDPSRIFTADDSGFGLSPKTGKVLIPKGYKHLKGNEKENITVFITFNADGRLCPPCIVYPCGKLTREVAESIPPDWSKGKSDSGWMTSEVLFEYIAKGLHGWILRNNVAKPVIFFVDGHRFHMSIEISEFCDKNGIILYALPSHTNHIMHPALSVLKPLKEYWQGAVKVWKNENPGGTLTITVFAPVFKQALENENISQHIKEGFTRCGLYPFDPLVVDYSKCVQNTIEHKEQPITEQNVEVELSYADFKSTYKVLNHFKSNLQSGAGDIDWLLEELKVFQEKVFQDNAANSTLTDEFLEQESHEVEYERNNEFLPFIEKNKPHTNILDDKLRPVSTVICEEEMHTDDLSFEIANVETIKEDNENIKKRKKEVIHRKKCKKISKTKRKQ